MEKLEIGVIINEMSDAGAIICLHDNFQGWDMISHLSSLVNLLETSEPQTTVNPQGRRIIPLNQCIN